MKILSQDSSGGSKTRSPAVSHQAQIGPAPAPHDLVIETHLTQMKELFDEETKRSRRYRIWYCMQRLNAVRRPQMVEYLERKMGILDG